MPRLRRQSRTKSIFQRSKEDSLFGISRKRKPTTKVIDELFECSVCLTRHKGSECITLEKSNVKSNSCTP